MALQKFIIDQENIRLDKWLSDKIPVLSRSKITNYIKQGKVYTADQKKLKAKDILPLATEIWIDFETEERTDPQPENIPLNIIFEDEDLIVLNKPIHMAVHPGVGQQQHTLVNALLYYTQGHLSDLNGVERPGIVHRLDKDTSGLMVICKNNRMHEAMASLFKNHQVKKIYHALTWGQPITDSGSIDAPIARHFGKRIEMAVQENGKAAYTEYQVLQRFTNRHNQPIASELRIRLFTGRTHQIRVHLAYIHLPIIGDPLYNKRKDHLHLPAQALYARELSFVKPFSKQKMFFKIEDPIYYQQAKEQLMQSDF